MDAKTLETIVVGIVCFGAGISKDIILEYLKLKPKQEAPSMKCQQHWIKLELLEQRVARHEVDLQEGKETFSLMRMTLNNIEKNIAVLVDRSKQHRQDDQE